MATEPHPEIHQTAPASTEDLQVALCRIAEAYGRGICRQPRRVAAMLRDLCPERRRENFLLVAALREGVVSDLVTGLDSVPDGILLARSVDKLREHLGLTEDSARWSVELWLPACRILATAPDRPVRYDSEDSGPEQEPEAAAENLLAPARPVDWPWLGLCLAAVLCSTVAICAVMRAAFFHYWSTFAAWLTEAGVLAAGLAVAGFGLALVARGMAGRSAPNQRSLDPNRAAGAMLMEVLTLLALPLVPVLSVGLWVAEWLGQLHILGQAHDLSFQLGRILQSLILALFLYQWMPLMTVIQGKIASSMVRRR
jgi:hypothetical protein